MVRYTAVQDSRDVLLQDKNASTTISSAALITCEENGNPPPSHVLVPPLDFLGMYNGDSAHERPPEEKQSSLATDCSPYIY